MLERTGESRERVCARLIWCRLGEICGIEGPREEFRRAKVPSGSHLEFCGRISIGIKFNVGLQFDVRAPLGEKLLVLAGKTYKERLWPAMEVFTFVRMGGALERVEITPLDTADDLGFETFAVENAKCFDDNDKAKLLTAIEAAFGAYAPFDALVRGLLVGANGGGVIAPRQARRRSFTRILGRQSEDYEENAASGSAAV